MVNGFQKPGTTLSSIMNRKHINDPHPMRKVLDLGCGKRKRSGATGIDLNPQSGADIFHDLNVFPYPLADSSFDEIYLDNVLEHLDNVMGVMEEVHRIVIPNGMVHVIVPYFRSRWAFIDPTHRHFFTVDSFSYFDPNHVICQRYDYTSARFSIERIIFNETIACGKVARLLKALANKWPHRYERFLAHIFPLDDISFHLKAIK